MKQKTKEISLKKYRELNPDAPSKQYLCRIIKKGKLPDGVVEVKMIANS